ncbi:MAG: integration host factor subunit beta [Acidobacteria bacterium]|jgi:integration host factor subunit beta|nr:integration host factor subunit beta [Acidobacteriota bacterium]|tara:strand:+ start:325 stop:600 length:276 start_codon:yes stop_codon:yes gene_type:complete
MTKADLIEEVSVVSRLSKKSSAIVVNTFFDNVVASLCRQEKVELRGFGSFKHRQRRARVGRNPRTGDRVEVPAKVVPYFKPGKDLRQLVNQ